MATEGVPSTGSAQGTRFVRLVDTWRDSQGLTHRQLAALLGRPESEWSHYRRGRREPSEEFARAVLAKAVLPWREVLERAWADDAVARVKSAVPAA